MTTASVTLSDLTVFLGLPRATLGGSDGQRYEWPCGCEACVLDQELCVVRWCLDHDRLADGSRDEN